MKKIILSILAVLLIIEEWLWESLSAFGHCLAYYLGLARFENWLAQTTPYQSLIAISIPIVIITPINIAAIWLIAQGLILQGVALEICAKLLGTLFVARFFSLTKQQLLTFSLIAWVYYKITYCLHWAHEIITETAVYQWIKKIKIDVKARVAAWLK